MPSEGFGMEEERGSAGDTPQESGTNNEGAGKYEVALDTYKIALAGGLVSAGQSYLEQLSPEEQERLAEDLFEWSSEGNDDLSKSSHWKEHEKVLRSVGAVLSNNEGTEINSAVLKDQEAPLTSAFAFRFWELHQQRKARYQKGS